MGMVGYWGALRGTPRTGGRRVFCAILGTCFVICVVARGYGRVAVPKSAKKRRRGLAPPPEKLKNALGVAFSFVGAFDVERRGGGVADVLECDAVFA